MRREVRVIGEEGQQLGIMSSRDAMKLAKKLAIHMTDVLKCDGFNLVQNNHEVAGQTVFHFHMHLIPRYKDAKNNDILMWTHETFSPEEMQEICASLKA